MYTITESIIRLIRILYLNVMDLLVRQWLPVAFRSNVLLNALLYPLGMCLTIGPAHAQWLPQGPSPTVTASKPYGNTSGAIEVVLTDLVDSNRAYIGAVNGGIWGTSNLTSNSPTWVPLTDQERSLSIADIKFDPLNANTLFAGIGQYSSNGGLGSGPLTGLLKSVDAGQTWISIASATFSGKQIRSIVPMSMLDPLTMQEVVLVATRGQGIFRSTNGGDSFSRISGTGGIPLGDVSHMVIDPGDPRKLYAALPNTGIFVSTDTGSHWSNITANLPSSMLNIAERIELSVSLAGTRPVYAALIGRVGGGGPSTQEIYRWDGSNWTAMGLRASVGDLNPNGQGDRHFAMLAHQTDPTVVFVAGDAGGVWRGSINNWARVDGLGANGTAPHPDSRGMVYTADGRILESGDGGISRLINPDGVGGTTRRWEAINANLQVTEFWSVAYDPLNDILWGGTQDNGSAQQSAAGSHTYTDVTDGDGGGVALDATLVNDGSLATVLRYSQVGCNVSTIDRRSYDKNNVHLTDSTVRLASPSTPTIQTTGLHHDGSGQPITCGKYIVNAVELT